tara:strand:- start:124 stop:261 length:138 start_codon:yes stop_codon:yes gene_type:complete
METFFYLPDWNHKNGYKLKIAPSNKPKALHTCYAAIDLTGTVAAF